MNIRTMAKYLEGMKEKFKISNRIALKYFMVYGP